MRYARHTLDIAEVGEHIRQGKLPTQLALTWDGRVSFVLTEQLALKKIKLLDVVLEGPSNAGKADDGFDTDVAITTGELGRLIPDLVDALGGPLKLGEAGTSTADKVITALTGQAATASPYAPVDPEDATAPF